MTSRNPKIFTLEEAKQTLPYVKNIVSDLVSLHRELDGVENKRSDSYVLLKKQIEKCRQELFFVGCQIKNEKRGRVSFFWEKGKNMAELYWQFGEEDIYYWKTVGNKNLHLLSGAFRKIESKVSRSLGQQVVN